MRVDSNNTYYYTNLNASNQLNYKGTAFGDPAKFNGNVLVKENNSAKSYPVEYKGTAFGDPAKFDGNQQISIREMERAAMPYKGSNIDKYV